MRGTVGAWSEDTERRLLAEAAAGNARARRRLIEAYLVLVSKIARRHAGRTGVPFEDLMQEGALALVQAVDHYDPTRGMKLSTYITWWVKQAVRRAALAHGRPVRIPERVWGRARELHGAEEALRSQMGRELRDDELLSSLGWPDEELREVRTALQPVVSLEAPIESEGTSLGDILCDVRNGDPVEEVARNDARHRLAEALASLPERERLVLSERAGFAESSRSLSAIGKKLGVSRERVRQLEGAALQSLRQRKRELGLEGLAA